MGIDLQTDVGSEVAEAVEQDQVFGGGQDGEALDEALELVGVGRLAGEGSGEHVAGVVMVVGDLDGELAAGAQHRGQVGEGGGVVGQPVQCGVGEHQVEARAGFEASDVLQGEA